MMTGDITPYSANSKVDRIERFQTLQAGEYWRAVVDIPSEGIRKDTVLLISSLRVAEDKLHTVCLHPHPDHIGQSVRMRFHSENGDPEERLHHFNADHRFLVTDFLDRFEYEANAKSIREKELQRVQGQVAELQSELQRAQSDPEYLRDHIQEELTAQNSDRDSTGSDSKLPSVALQAALPSPSSGVHDVLSEGISAEKLGEIRAQAKNSHAVASIQAKWIKGKTDQIGETIKRMTPYYSEQAAAAIAATEDVRRGVDRILQGVETLDLYVGDNVDLTRIAEGASAPASEPVTIVQRKLVIDEELAVFQDVDAGFDDRSKEKFFEELAANPKLVEQIFPAARCVLVMATTRRYIDYGEPIINQIMNRRNASVMLMIRDGENLFVVNSPVESHLGAQRLFPSKTEHDEIFRGWDGKNVSFEDVAYTDRLNDFEKRALHYRRFLVLLCGLDHREKVLGDFYDGPANFDFMTQEFQDRYFRFLRDDEEGTLLEQERETFAQWIKRMDSYLTSGSRVLCMWGPCMTMDAAPGAYTGPFDQPYQGFQPEEDSGIAIAQREKQTFFVKVRVSGFSPTSLNDRSFDCKVNLSAVETFGYLVLDAIDPDELEWFIHNRKARQNFLQYIGLFKRAIKAIRADQEQEREVRTELTEYAMSANNSETQAKALTDEVVRKWRSMNRGATVPRTRSEEMFEAIAQMKTLMAKLVQDPEELLPHAVVFAGNKGRDLLRVAIDGQGDTILYMSSLPEERDDRFMPFCWANRTKVKMGRRTLREVSSGWSFLGSRSANERTVFEAEEAGDYLDPHPTPFQRPSDKARMIDVADQGAERLLTLGQLDFTELFENWRKVRRETNRHNKLVENVNLLIPIGAHYKSEFSSRPESPRLVMLKMDAVFVLQMLADSDEELEVLKDTFTSIYASERGGEEMYDQCRQWRPELVAGPVPASRFKDGMALVSKKEFSGLFDRFENWDQRDNPIDIRLMNAIDKVRHMKQSTLWVSDAIAQHRGRPVIDNLLGAGVKADSWVTCYINVPNHFEPHRLGSMAEKDREEVIFNHSWAGIVPADAAFIAAQEGAINEPPRTFISLDEALEYGKEKLRKSLRLGREDHTLARQSTEKDSDGRIRYVLSEAKADE